MLSLCDRHASEKLLLCRQGESHSHSQHLPVLFPPPYPQASANREWSEAWKKGTCSTSKRNRTRVYSCQWSRIQTVIFHGSQSKTSGRCKYKGPFAPLVASSDLILVFPHTARMEDSFTVTQLPTTFQSMEDFASSLPCPETCSLFKASCIAVTLHASQITAMWSVSDVHIMFPLVFSEWKRTELVETACVKWAQLCEHYVLEKHKSIESLLWHQRVCPSNCYLS